MTNQIDQLEDAGWVVRVPDADDRRVVLVEMTPEGRSKIDAALRSHAGDELAAIAPLTAAEQAALVPILRKLLTFLKTGQEQGRAKQS